MELKEPLESTLRAAWALQACDHSGGQDICRPAPPMEDTSPSPQIDAEASHTATPSPEQPTIPTPSSFPQMFCYAAPLQAVFCRQDQYLILDDHNLRSHLSNHHIPRDQRDSPAAKSAIKQAQSFIRANFPQRIKTKEELILPEHAIPVIPGLSIEHRSYRCLIPGCAWITDSPRFKRRHELEKHVFEKRLGPDESQPRWEQVASQRFKQPGPGHRAWPVTLAGDALQPEPQPHQTPPGLVAESSGPEPPQAHRSQSGVSGAEDSRAEDPRAEDTRADHHAVGSSRPNGYDESTDLSIPAVKVEEPASVTSESSFHSSDGVQSGVDSSQDDGSGCITNLTSAPETTPDVSDQRATDDEALALGTARSTGLIPVGVLEKGTVSEYDTLGQAVKLLEENNWVRTCYDEDSPNVRVHVDPNMAHRNNSQRSISKLRDALKLLMAKIDCTSEAWTGRKRAETPDVAMSNGVDDESLWFIFNTLEDPNPQVDLVQGAWSRKAMQYLLSDEDLSDLGLNTRLYPYQRRSAAMMVQREAQPAMMLDPRLQACQSPEGLEYYYNKEDGFVTLQKDMYDEATGGILAETMGCGKTLISLAVIWATRGHVPKIPIEYLPDIPTRETTGSLMEMAAAAAGRRSLPWKNHFVELAQHGKFHDSCVKACEGHGGFYEIPPPETRHAVRQSTTFTRPPPRRIRLCSATLIIAPNNLLDHWQREISVHTDGLKVRVLRYGTDKTPSADELFGLDIVLFSKTRFEREAGEPSNNRRTRHIPNDSPLKDLHWLRVIVDEGHNVGGHGQVTNMMHMLKQLRFERRWVISGTPSDNMIGLEVSLAAHEDADDESPEEVAAAVLQGRKKTGNAGEREMKDLDSLRGIVINFLDLKPWSVCSSDWTRYIKPKGKDGIRRKSPAIRATLQGLVVRHQDETVSREITLPKLHNKTVYLEPTFYDRLTINLFLFRLAVNAITSEREGQDYMFDPKNRKHLNQLINNLRQAGFWWAGSVQDPQDSIDHALGYSNKNRDKMAAADIQQLTQGMEIARKANASASWQGFKQLQELGIFIQNFPADHRAHWTVDGANSERDPLLIGITQARHAQKWVAEHLGSPDPAEGLSSRGIRVRLDLKKGDKKVTARGAPEGNATSQGSPKSRSKRSPKKTPQKTSQRLPEDSPLTATKFIATASAKLTYLLDRVWELHKEEKIIIFYDNANSAWWIAEGLELLGIKYRIYASALRADLREEYLKLFRETEHIRVLLMDLRQASHGLHLVQASRVFIVNPIWQATVESQAIKRAHRLGQTRPVYVETLVLRDTLEDRMLRRRKEMSEAEMQRAEKSLLDDTTMSDIIQREPFLAMDAAEAAFLKHPTGFFDRHSLGEGEATRSPKRSAGSAPASEEPRHKKPRIGFASSVDVIDGPGSRRTSFAVQSPSPGGSPGQGEGRVSMFGPFNV